MRIQRTREKTEEVANEKGTANYFYFMTKGISKQILTILSRRNELANLCSHLEKCMCIFSTCGVCLKIRHCMF